MKKAILATKVGMTQIFNEDGVLTPVTVLQAGPCVVTQVKTEENDGYKAVQVGFVDKREKLVTKPKLILKKATVKMNFFFITLSLLFSAAKKRTAHFNPNTKDETHITIQKTERR